MARGSMKVAVMGPDATPPESKAMAVKMGSVKKVRPRAMAYPGTTKYQMEIPVSTRVMARPTEMETPMDRVFIMTDLLMAPEVTCSTCSLSTCTAGSAATTI